jgi:hypothetical protein
MNPVLQGAAQRLAPILSRLFQAQPGRILGLGTRANTAVEAMPEPMVQPMSPQPAPPGPQVPISGPNGWMQTNGQPWQQPTLPQLPSTDVAARPIADPFALTAQAQVPMPRPRPTEAPAAPQPAPDMPWWQRNAYMQADENGQALNPQLAALAQRYFQS